ncbi:helix-turn-helix transcriptional regulator [Actinomyces viscosus]|uniref:helix-turn-helix domain-containing protein n=1 Tax=Actinomyces viscosus TaxID=1656 RepID=UPI0028EAAFCF|nr:helix-turn-helix transcriptional regulator [Actinomyces viscosus]
MDIYELLGEDPDVPGHRHARSLVSADRALIRELVAVRERSGMTQADVARAMGTSQASVSRFESGHADAHLSTVRRYAKAVGAVIRHEVVPVDGHEVRLATRNAGMSDYRWDSSSTEAARRVSTGKVVGA